MKEGQELNKFDLELHPEEEDITDPDDPTTWKLDFVLTEGEDAMSRLGYGVVSYFGLIHTFMLVLFLITCVNIPVMINNS